MVQTGGFAASSWLVRQVARDTEGTEKTCLFFEFLSDLCVSVAKGFL